MDEIMRNAKNPSTRPQTDENTHTHREENRKTLVLSIGQSH